MQLHHFVTKHVVNADCCDVSSALLLLLLLRCRRRLS